MTKRKAEQTHKNPWNERMKVKQAKTSLAKAHLAAHDLQNCLQGRHLDKSYIVSLK